MKKMSLIPTRAGYMYECFVCKTVLSPEEADAHECDGE
jgi:hypothetical protein